MSLQQGNRWEDELAYETETAFFVRDKADLAVGDATVSHSHVARRAFDDLNLDGILCSDDTPLVYFKQVDDIDNAEVASLHRTFWNHGGAPILAIVTSVDVQVYSGCIRPVEHTTDAEQIPAFVRRIDRVSSRLMEFRVSVESGEFFRVNANSFDPDHRVDRDLLDRLQDVRERLINLPTSKLDADALDALLCRLVFTSYLFDRKIVTPRYLKTKGLRNITRLTDILSISREYRGPAQLYRLFDVLRKDFNGDLFSDDLTTEAEFVSEDHLELLDEFFRGTTPSGQKAFWPYDFSKIPIETISSIYERFLKDSRRQGAFYTPRFLVETVLNLALKSSSTVLDCTFLDPACGSGIFLVGLFNRMANEWCAKNPNASNGQKAKHLRRLLCENLYGIDLNPGACRIAAFSLYLAYLDQLSPREIDRLREQGHQLPTLVYHPTSKQQSRPEGNIWCCDYFSPVDEEIPNIDLIVGNPPWANSVGRGSPAAGWCAANGLRNVPGKQIATAFAWKAGRAVATNGRVCLLLPQGVLFNRTNSAVNYHRTFFETFAVETVVNLADYQRFLFDKSEHAAIVALYRGTPPDGLDHNVQYLTPKVDWFASHSDIIAIYPEDRKAVTVGDICSTVEDSSAPEIWSQNFWGTPRDIRLLDRLSSYPRLMALTGRIGHGGEQRRWTIAAGVRPPGESDDLKEAEVIALPSRLFVQTKTRAIELFLMEEDCDTLPEAQYLVRKRSNKSTEAFRGPHVLIKEGFSNIAYADFDVSFLQSFRAISGPREDWRLLIFLAAFLRSSLARFFLFHTSSSWGISRQRVGEDELLRVPFPLPDSLPDPARAWEIIGDVVEIYERAKGDATGSLRDRQTIVDKATVGIDSLIDLYFDVDPLERLLIDDTVDFTIPSTRPTRKRKHVPTIQPSNRHKQEAYAEQLVRTLNGWTRSDAREITGHVIASARLGIGVAVLSRARAAGKVRSATHGDSVLLNSLNRLRTVVSTQYGNIEIIRGAKVFDADLLYVIKPIASRFWTKTAALNDADEIAGAILASGV